MEKDRKDWLLVTVRGYDVEKGYIYANRIPDGQPIVIAKRNTIKQDWLKWLSDTEHRAHAPSKSILAIFNAETTTKNNTFYIASWAQTISKSPNTENIIVTPIRINSRRQSNNNASGVNATVLDKRPISVRTIEELRKASVEVLNPKCKTSVDIRGRRGFMIRIGHKAADGSIDGNAWEFWGNGKNSPQEIWDYHLQRAPREGKKHNILSATLNASLQAFNSSQSYVEITGITSGLISTYNDDKYKHELLNLANYKTSVVNKTVDTYSMAAIVTDKDNQTGSIKRQIPLPKNKIINSRAGILGNHGSDKFPSIINDLNLSSDIVDSAVPNIARPSSKYPLVINDHINKDTGEVTSFRVSGTKEAVEKYKNRIMSVTADLKPFYIAKQFAYSFPNSYRQYVESKLSDLCGTPAIYLSNINIENNRYILVKGRTSEEPYNSAVKHAAKVTTTPYNTARSNYLFPEENRIELVQHLSEVLNIPSNIEPKVQNNSRNSNKYSTPKKDESNSSNKYVPSFYKWVESKFHGDPYSIIEHFNSEIESVATEAGVDWGFSSTVITFGAPGEKTPLIKGSKSVRPLKRSHAGSVAIGASLYEAEGTDTNNDPAKLTSIKLMFINLEIDRNNSFVYDSFPDLKALYDYEVKNGISFDEYKEITDSERINRENKRLKDAQERAKQELLDNERSRKYWEEKYNNLADDTGDLSYWVGKKIDTSITKSIELKRGKDDALGEYSAIRLHDISDEFKGVELYYSDYWLDEKGKKKNKRFVTGTMFRDPITDLPTAVHCVVGNINADSPIMFCEGVADGETNRLATSLPNVVALNAGNLYHVVSAYRTLYPNTRFIIPADNDAYKPHAGNPGLLAAIRSSRDFDAYYAVPDFTGYKLDNQPKDFTDLRLLSNISEVRNQLSKLRKAPEDLLEYLKLETRYIGLEKLKNHLNESVEAIITNGKNGSCKSSIMLTLVSTAIDQYGYKDVIDHIDSTLLSENELTKLSSSLATDKPSVTVTEGKNAETKKKHTFIKDLSDGKNKKLIESVLNDILKGKALPYNQKRQGWYAPASLRHLIDTYLSDVTGSPRLYIGRSRSLGKDISYPVVRGNFSNKEFKTKIESLVSYANPTFVDDEYGFVLENEEAIPFIKQSLSSYFKKSLNPTPKTTLNKESEIPGISDIPNLDNISKLTGVEKGRILLHHAKLKTLPYYGIYNDHDHMFSAIYAHASQLTKEIRNSKKHTSAIKESIKYINRLSDIEAFNDYLNEEQIHRLHVIRSHLEIAIDNNLSEDKTELIDKTIKEVSKKTSIDIDIIDSVVKSDYEVLKSTYKSTTGENIADDVLNNTNTGDVCINPYEINPTIYVCKHIDLDMLNDMDSMNGNVSIFKKLQDASTKGRSLPMPCLTLAGNGKYDTNNREVPLVVKNKGLHKVDAWVEVSAPGNATINYNDIITLYQDNLNDQSHKYDNITSNISDERDLRLNKAIEITTIVVEKGFTAEEFHDSFITQPGSPYYDDTKNIFDINMFQKDMLFISESDEYTDFENVTSTSKLFHGVYHSISSNRIKFIEEYIDAYIALKGTTTYKTFEKYFSGKVESELTIENPYIIEDEVDYDLIKTDLSNHTELTSLITYFNHSCDMFDKREEISTADLFNDSLELDKSKLSSLNTPWVESYTEDPGELERTNYEKINIGDINLNDSNEVSDIKEDKFKSLLIKTQSMIDDGYDYNEYIDLLIKNDGDFRASNPYYNNETDKLDKKSLQEDIVDAGYTSIKNLFNSCKVNNTDESSHTVIKYKPDNYDYSLPIKPQYNNLTSVLMKSNIPSEPITFIPQSYNDWINSELSYVSLHPIFSEDIENTNSKDICNRYTRDEIVLLCDVHGVHVNSHDVEIDLIDKVNKSLVVRNELVNSDLSDLVMLDTETLRDMCKDLHISSDGTKKTLSESLIKQTKLMKLDSRRRITEYGYIQHLVICEDQGIPIPASAKEDLDLIQNKHESFDKALLYSINKKENTDLLKAINDVAPFINSNKAYCIDSNYTIPQTPRIIGSPGKDYVTSGVYHYAISNDNEISMPPNNSYYSELGNGIIGTNNPIETGYLRHNSIKPLSIDSLIAMYQPHERLANNQGYITYYSHNLDELQIAYPTNNGWNLDSYAGGRIKKSENSKSFQELLKNNISTIGEFVEDPIFSNDYVSYVTDTASVILNINNMKLTIDKYQHTKEIDILLKKLNKSSIDVDTITSLISPIQSQTELEMLLYKTRKLEEYIKIESMDAVLESREPDYNNDSNLVNWLNECKTLVNVVSNLDNKDNAVKLPEVIIWKLSTDDFEIHYSCLSDEQKLQYINQSLRSNSQSMQSVEEDISNGLYSSIAHYIHETTINNEISKGNLDCLTIAKEYYPDTYDTYISHETSITASNKSSFIAIFENNGEASIGLVKHAKNNMYELVNALDSNKDENTELISPKNVLWTTSTPVSYLQNNGMIRSIKQIAHVLNSLNKTEEHDNAAEAFSILYANKLTINDIKSITNGLPEDFDLYYECKSSKWSLLNIKNQQCLFSSDSINKCLLEAETINAFDNKNNELLTEMVIWTTNSHNYETRRGFIVGSTQNDADKMVTIQPDRIDPDSRYTVEKNILSIYKPEMLNSLKEEYINRFSGPTHELTTLVKMALDNSQDTDIKNHLALLYTEFKNNDIDIYYLQRNLPVNHAIFINEGSYCIKNNGEITSPNISNIDNLREYISDMFKSSEEISHSVKEKQTISLEQDKQNSTDELIDNKSNNKRAPKMRIG